MPLKTLKGNRYDELDVPGRFCHKTKRAAKQNSARYIMRGENQIKILTKLSTSHGARLELVSKELNHFGVIAGLFRQIGGHNSRFVLFCSF